MAMKRQTRSRGGVYQREVAGIGVVEVRRSTRRKKTVSAYFEHGVMVLAIPASMTAQDEDRWLEHMSARLAKKTRPQAESSAGLQERAAELAAQYLPELSREYSIRWVSNQHRRWGSCTTTTGEIRISDRLVPMPSWVQDYVILHELTHLLNPHHDKAFWQVMNRYPDAQRALGFLEGYSYCTNMPASPGDDVSQAKS